MKKLITITLIVGLLTVPTMAQEVSVYLNNQRMVFDQNPIIESGRTLVPLRSIFEGLGAEVKWEPVTQEVRGLTDDKEVILRVGDTSANVNGEKVLLDVPAKIENGRTLVPLRFISESLGTEVKWNEEEYRIDILDENISEEQLLNEARVRLKPYFEEEWKNARIQEKFEMIYKEKIQQYTEKDILCILQDDYNKDGFYEAFVFTGNKDELDNEFACYADINYEECWLVTNDVVKNLHVSGKLQDIDQIKIEGETFVDLGKAIYRANGEEITNNLTDIIGENISDYLISIDSMEDDGENYILKGTAGLIEWTVFEHAEWNFHFAELDKKIEIEVPKNIGLYTGDAEHREFVSMKDIYEYEILGMEKSWRDAYDLVYTFEIKDGKCIGFDWQPIP